MMTSLSPTLQASQLWQEIRGNRRLQWGLLLILLIAAAEFGMRWFEHIQHSENELRRLQDQRVQLQSNSQDEQALRNQLKELTALQKTAESRMWVVPTEAIGQALQKDWLQTLFKNAGVVPQSITLASPRQSSSQLLPAAGASVAQQSELHEAPTLREFRSTLVFSFSPDNLEKILAALEGADLLVQVEALNASRKDRRVELTINMQMEVDKVRAEEAKSGTTEHDQAN